MNIIATLIGASVVWVSTSMGTIPNVNTASDAITVAKRLCAKNIPADSEVRWQAWYSAGQSKFMPLYSNGWNVDGQYDPKHLPPGVLSVIDISVFIPKNGPPSECTELSN
ncbi:MAG TPA: hypothetical protein VID67_01745 [Rhizomicrobium sp.]